MASERLTLDQLRSAIEDGSIDTVRVCIADHYGMLRGRRLVGEVFAADPQGLQAYCDGALIWDVHCDIFESTDYSNFGTGYPDVFARPDLPSLIRCGWSPGSTLVMTEVLTPHGERSPLDPRGLLRIFAERIPTGPIAASLELRAGDGALTAGWSSDQAPAFAQRWREGIELSGIALERVAWDSDRAVLRAELEPAEPLVAADQLVAVRSAAREIGLVDGLTVTAMPLLEASQRPARMLLEAAEPLSADAEARLNDLALLCRPLPLDWVGAEPLTSGAELAASPQASPYLAIAALVSAIGAPHAATAEQAPSSYSEAADHFDAAAWTREWFGEMFVHDTLELARREATMRSDAAADSQQLSDWDIERYGEVG